MPVTQDKIEYPQIQIFVPHVKLFPATLISLIGYNYTLVYAPGDYEYGEYFKKRWDEGKTFINVEQDIVPYPGAIKAIWDCPEEICLYDFHLPCQWSRKLENEKVGLPIGCIKIVSTAIQKMKEIWEKKVLWDVCDLNLTKGIIDAGIKVHQHYPSVVNANPVLLGKDWNGL